MSAPLSRTRAFRALIRGVAVSAFIVCALSGSAGAQVSDAQGGQTLQRRCAACHLSDLITQQRLTKAGWTREVDKMIRWGAAVEEAEKDELVAHLSERFGTRPVAMNPATALQDQGSSIFKSRCLVCHRSDLAEQQRLSRPAWVREVEKMIRWGAAVTDAEKDSLVDFLSAHFAPGTEPASR